MIGPNASAAYRTKREELLAAELELRHAVERVAEMRRQLPQDNFVGDYTFLDLDGAQVKLSELFTDPQRTLVVYHYMFGKAQTSACPMCSMWLDGFDAVAPHLERRLDFAVVAAATPDELKSIATKRGWKNMRLLSAGDSTFKRDFDSETEDGSQESAISVFRHGDGGNIVHTYTGHPQLSDEHWRGIDLLSPVWNVFDLTPEGRGDWFPSLDYDEASG